jgi:hypothetical protein
MNPSRQGGLRPKWDFLYYQVTRARHHPLEFNPLSGLDPFVKRVVDLLDKKSDNLELVFTGRKCPQELIERADLVSVIHEIKHPFQKGLKARKGIEF